MEYRLDFFNNFDEFVGSIDFEAFSDEAAIVTGDRVAKAARDRRGELWYGTRQIKLYPY